MTDLTLLKKTLLKINCNFLAGQTLDGYSVMIGTNEKVLFFYFDKNGKYITTA